MKYKEIFFQGLYSDQARYCIGPDLGPKCSQGVAKQMMIAA